jgi:hypothetical protein
LLAGSAGLTLICHQHPNKHQQGISTCQQLSQALLKAFSQVVDNLAGTNSEPVLVSFKQLSLFTSTPTSTDYCNRNYLNNFINI